MRGEWQAVLRAAEERKREAAQRALQLEQERRRLLASQLARWREARDVREFVTDMRDKAPVEDPKVAKFLDWCTRFVVELDPATHWEEPRDDYGRMAFSPDWSEIL